MQPILSICIPTYNRAEHAYECVMSCLKLSREDIEVVCLNNASTDDTAEKLATIEDSRFSYYANEENIGYPNIVEVLRYAKGKFALLLSDEDKLNLKTVDRTMTLLESDQNSSIVWLALDSDHRKQNVYYKSGHMNGLRFILCNTYISGVCIRTSLIEHAYHTIPRTGSFWKMYPHILLMSALYDRSNQGMLLCGQNGNMTVTEGKVLERDLSSIRVFGASGNAYNVLGRYELAVAALEEVPVCLLDSKMRNRKNYFKALKLTTYCVFSFPSRALLLNKPQKLKDIAYYMMECGRYVLYTGKLFALITKKVNEYTEG